MKAIVYHRYGSTEELRLADVEPPRIDGPRSKRRGSKRRGSNRTGSDGRDTDVLVRVHAASVNSWDRDNLRGAFANRMMLGVWRPRVSILGGDISGTVEAVGPGVTRFAPGDEVFGDLCNSGWGAFAEYVRAPEPALTRKPAGLTHVAAAAMPQAAVLALQSMRGERDRDQVQAGQRVLINGGGGGAGSFAIQLAKLYGAEVTGVDSGPKLDLMRALGADRVLDYRAQDYTRTGERYDVIVDFELHRPVSDCRRALAPGGRLAVVGGAVPRILQTVLLGKWLARRPGRTGQRVGLLLHEANRELAHLGELAAAGRITSAVEREYALAEVPLAMERMCRGLILGKAVIAIASRGSRVG